MADKEARNNISKDKSLEIAISQIEKEFGKGSIMRLGDTGAAMTDVVAISTGSMALDLALGIGGSARRPDRGDFRSPNQAARPLSVCM